MSGDIGLRIAEMITANGKSAAAITHGLKELGGGDMQRGVSFMADFFRKDGIVKDAKAGRRGFAKGNAIGLLEGITAAGAAFIVYTYVKKRKDNKMLAVLDDEVKEDGKRIINAFEKTTEEVTSGENERIVFNDEN